MTNKDLSRELCEICGIKPMYRLEDINALYNEDMYNEFCEMRLNKGLLIPTGTKAIFPDFTQPENFVKLLEIVSKKQVLHFGIMAVILVVLFTMVLKIFLKQMRVIFNIIF